MATVKVGFEEVNQVDYPVHEAIDIITRIVKGTYLSQTSGIPKIYIYMAKKPTNLHRGTPYRMSQNYIDRMNQAIIRIADGLIMEQVQPEMAAIQLSDLNAWLKLAPFFTTYTDKGVGWMKAHIDKRNQRYYNQFDADTLRQINNGLQDLARQIAAIHVVA